MDGWMGATKKHEEEAEGPQKGGTSLFFFGRWATSSTYGYVFFEDSLFGPFFKRKPNANQPVLGAKSQF